ncbi:hypothetical protein I0630_000402 [Staphylococcus pseudintermedius]|nr:hypothetical protein [Staphylococcus pseudintermedius]EGQ3894767.1 hypothetical protein [Staphylococcus pseudintermedius]
MELNLNEHLTIYNGCGVLFYAILSDCAAVAFFIAQTVLMALKDASVVQTMQ